MIANGNEEKRNRLWQIVMTASTIVIVLIAVFFIVKLFTANPLEGTWKYDDSDLVISVGSGSKAEIQWPEKFADQKIKVDMNYGIDKKTKTFTLQYTTDAVTQAVKDLDGALTDKEVESVLKTLEGTFDYSIDGQQLTLTDREYGDQMFFSK